MSFFSVINQTTKIGPYTDFFLIDRSIRERLLQKRGHLEYRKSLITRLTYLLLIPTLFVFYSIEEHKENAISQEEQLSKIYCYRRDFCNFLLKNNFQK